MFESLFLTHSSLQAVVIISLICAVGLIFGKVRVWGVSLGVTFVFFAGIVAGHFGLTIDERMLLFAENFGLVLFVYSLGVQVGPGFFASLKKGGLKMKAEEWITDEYAFNKKGGLKKFEGKFRRKTIELKDLLIEDLKKNLTGNK